MVTGPQETDPRTSRTGLLLEGVLQVALVALVVASLPIVLRLRQDDGASGVSEALPPAYVRTVVIPYVSAVLFFLAARRKGDRPLVQERLPPCKKNQKARGNARIPR